MTAKLCVVCSIRRPQTGSKGTETSPHSDMCNYCFEEGGWENTHSDANHEAVQESLEDVEYGKTNHKSEAEYLVWLKEQRAEVAGCWICHPELNLAKLPAKAAATGAKVQGTRRPQLNHKGHSHPATPAARRACKAAFWDIIKAGGDLVGPDLQNAMDKWDSHLDGFGKPMVMVPTSPIVAKAAGLTVVPRGPKGGVISQLKKGNPAK